ncbi:MAG: hypothetical protein ACE5IR_16395 [bacterium]
MNWGKAVLAGAVGGLVVSVYNYLMHGVIMASTYTGHAAFNQGPPKVAWFIVVAIVIGVMGGILFAKTRDCWGAGVKGGVTFGFFLGLVAFFAQFYWPLVINGFPYFLAWCWGGIILIGWMVFGAVAGMMYKTSA